MHVVIGTIRFVLDIDETTWAKIEQTFDNVAAQSTQWCTSITKEMAILGQTGLASMR